MAAGNGCPRCFGEKNDAKNPISGKSQIIAAAGATYLMNEFSKPEKRQEIKRALVKSYNDKIRPQLENWAKEQIDLCNE